MEIPDKIILTCAGTDVIHMPSMSPYLPAPAGHTRATLDAVAAGVAVIHLHTRDRKREKPDQSREAFEAILEMLRGRADAVINIPHREIAFYAGGGASAPCGLFPSGACIAEYGYVQLRPIFHVCRFHDFRFDWEKESLEKSRDCYTGGRSNMRHHRGLSLN